MRKSRLIDIVCVSGRFSLSHVKSIAFVVITVMELPSDINVQLAAAVACCFRNHQRITRSQNTQQSQVSQKMEQFARNNFTTRRATSNSRGLRQRRTQTDQKNKQCSTPDNVVFRTSDNVESLAILSQPCSRNKQKRAWTETSATKIGIPTKIAEWKNKLDHLSFLFRNHQAWLVESTKKVELAQIAQGTTALSLSDTVVFAMRFHPPYS
ncbi:unnamed protein product [Wuchereria bancrofti]|uniref:Uncharacterized protein n=1 Tax=Wuchereria bancrofti TaxID=6293 RepID=A0A3P7E0N3_WUCBA|nr:unnamed protein product [Wuchereria bancrofti]